jgi:hypothetical protein
MGRTSTLLTTVVSAASFAAALVFASAVPSSLSAQAAACTADDIPAAVDATGAQLRTYTMQTQPQLQPRLKALSAKNGWGDEGYEEAAYNHLRDAKLEQLDKTSNELLARIDQLGEVKPGEAPDCARLDGIKAAGVELLAVMKAKTAHVMGKIDAELGSAPATVASSTPLKPTILAEVPTAAPTTPSPATPPPTQAAPPPAPRVAAQPPVASSPTTTTATTPPATAPASRPVAETPPPVRKPSSAGGEGWQTKTSQPPSQPISPPAAPSRPSEITVAVLPPVPPLQPTLPGGQPRPDEGLRAVPPVDDAEDGYTIDEIREASRGVFGNLSTGLASVIEHAFRRSGRPTGYILGTEGGGFAILMTQLAGERLIQAIRAVSASEAAIEWTLAYAVDRKMFGQTLADFQNTRFSLANLHAQVLAQRVFVDRCMQLHAEGKLDAVDAASCKLVTTDLQFKVMDECLQFLPTEAIDASKRKQAQTQVIIQTQRLLIR